MSTTLEIRAPLEQTEGTRSQVLRWLKQVGETVRVNEPLIELETDKATVEVPAPADGVLCEIVRGAQEEVEPGDLLGRLEQRGTAESTSGASSAATQQPSPPRTPVAPEGARGGTKADASAVRRDSSRAAQLSPAVRRLLAEHGLNAADVQGTGEGGRITVADVLQHVGARAAPAAKPAAAPDTSEERPCAPSHWVPHSAVRKRIAERMVESLLRTAPHVTSVFEADMTAVLAHRQATKDDFSRRGVPLTMTAYFVAAAVEAIRAVPEANSRWTDSALEIYDSVDMGIATALESGGLVVPVLRRAESLDLFGVAAGLNDLVTRAREGKLQPQDMRGGTFTISNHGVSGSLLAAPIVINQPQSAILGTGKLQKRAVVVEEGGEDRLVIRPMCYVTLTIDHRVMDGLQANRFLQAFTAALERWPAP